MSSLLAVAKKGGNRIIYPNRIFWNVALQGTVRN
jgi:hypothetical protein